MLFAMKLALLLAVSVELNPFLARMRQFSGPVWSAHLSAVVHVNEGGTMTELHEESAGPRFISSRCDGVLCNGTYFDGRRLYAIDINGTMLPLTDSSNLLLRAERMVASLSFLAPDFAARGGRIVDEGISAFEGAPYRALVLSAGDGIAARIYVDPRTAAVRYMQNLDGDVTVEYRDYTKVADRYHLPQRIFENGSLFERYDTFAVLAAPLSPPRGLVASFAARPAVVATDPQQATPIFPCTLGGIATTCLLDSGNSGLSISLSLAEELKAPALGSFGVQGLGDYATEVVRAGDLQIGTMTLPAANYVVLHDIDRYGYRVVLGADAFATTTVDIDSAAHRVTFGAAAPVSGIPLSFEEFVPVVDVLLGAVPARLAIDTGDESSINLAYDFYQAHRDLFALTGERSVSGIGGNSVEMMGTIPQVQIGSLSIASAPIGTTREMHGTAFGHIGVGLLRRFNVTIDYASGLLELTPPVSR